MQLAYLSQIRYTSHSLSVTYHFLFHIYFFSFFRDFSSLSSFLLLLDVSFVGRAWSSSLCVLLSNDFLLFLISSNSSIASSLFTLAVSSIIFAAVMLLVLMGLLASALSNFDVASFRSSSATLNFCLAFSSYSFKLSSVSSKDFFFSNSLSFSFLAFSDISFIL